MHFKIVETSWVYSMYSIFDPFHNFIIFQTVTEHKCAIILPLVLYFIQILRQGIKVVMSRTRVIFVHCEVTLHISVLLLCSSSSLYL